VASFLTTRLRNLVSVPASCIPPAYVVGCPGFPKWLHLLVPQALEVKTRGLFNPRHYRHIRGTPFVFSLFGLSSQLMPFSTARCFFWLRKSDCSSFVSPFSCCVRKTTSLLSAHSQSLELLFFTYFHLFVSPAGTPHNVRQNIPFLLIENVLFFFFRCRTAFTLCSNLPSSSAGAGLLLNPSSRF